MGTVLAVPQWDNGDGPRCHTCHPWDNGDGPRCHTCHPERMWRISSFTLL